MSFDEREYVAFCSPDGENAVAAAIEGDSESLSRYGPAAQHYGVNVIVCFSLALPLFRAIWDLTC